MATITTNGLSGLDVQGTVTKLVAADRAPYDQRIARAESKVTTEFSALAQLKGAMSSLQAAVGALKKPGDFQVRSVNTSPDTFFAATATGSAAPGNYQVEVRQLASATQLGSVAIPGGATALAGSGTLAISIGSASITVGMSATSTLADLRDAINKAPGNPGVSAALVTDISGTHLVLGSSVTGAGNAMRVTVTGGDGALDRFAYDPPTTTNMTELTPARDSIVFVSGYEIHDPDLQVEGAIDGVTLNLKKAETGTISTLGIAVDNAGIRDKVSRFVSAYNVLATQVTKLRSYDPETKAAGPLLGDAMLRGIEAQMSRLLSEPVAGLGDSPYTTLASLGITKDLKGALTLDNAKFDAALAKDPSAASQLFTSESGLSGRLGDYLDKRLGAGGEFATRDERITAKRKDIDKQKEQLNVRMAQVQARYLKQFNALDSLLTQMQSTSSYLNQQLSSISQIGK